MNAKDEPACILVVDDDPDVLAYLTTYFDDQGYCVLAAAGGDEALALARERHPDLICLDIAMPPPTGVKVYRELRSDPDLASIPVVMVTGVETQFERFISTRRQVPPPDGYVAKPFQVEELHAIVKDLLCAAPH